MNLPVLARTLELAGLSTLLATSMPIWAERIGVPRTLAVAFPFGHALGLPHNAVQQTQITEEALMVLETTGQARDCNTLRRNVACANEGSDQSLATTGALTCHTHNGRSPAQDASGTKSETRTIAAKLATRRLGLAQWPH